MDRSNVRVARKRALLAGPGLTQLTRTAAARTSCGHRASVATTRPRPPGGQQALRGFAESSCLAGLGWRGLRNIVDGNGGGLSGELRGDGAAPGARDRCDLAVPGLSVPGLSCEVHAFLSLALWW